MVVEVTVRPAGYVGSVRCLQSFDDAATSSVISAVRHWQFTSIEKDERVHKADRVGKLLFRFKYENGRPKVVALGMTGYPARVSSRASGHETRSR